jgi:recombination protein RecA
VSKHLDKVVKLLQRKFGETAAQRLGSGRQASGQVKEVIPTGIEVVDHHLLGIGGLPVGRISEVCGEYGCGKTAFAYQCAAAVQRVGGSVYFFDNERTFDEERATTYGCDIDSMVLPECVTMEMGIEQTKLILENHDVESGPMLIVWDTVAAMLPKADRGREAGERGTAEQARLLSTELPKIVPLLSARRAHLLLLNQIRKKIGVFFGPDTVTPGGNSVAFYTSWRAQFFGGKAIKKGDEHTGKMVTLLTTKTKFTAPHRKARLRLDYETGWNNEWSTLEHAKTVGVAQRTAKGEAAHLLALNKLGWLRGATNEERGDGDSEEAKSEEEE